MKALVLGGTRFFGKRLVSLLLQEGTEVTLLNRGRTKDPFGDEVHRIVLDRKELSSTSLADQHWDIVYDQVCYDAAEATGARAAFNGKTDRYIFTSTQAVYDAGAAIKESAFDPLTYHFDKPIDRSEDYAEGKRQAEAVLFQAAFPVVAVRFPIVLGEDDYTERLKFHIDRIRAGKPLYLPNLQAKLSLVSSADAAAFLAFLAHHDVVGPINCCSEEPIALSSLIEYAEEATEQKALTVGRPDLGETSPFGIATDWYMDVSRAKQLGFTATPLKAWLPELVKQLAATRG
ncbi:MAG: hypothetical protein JW395_0689 [Nitrospira sp.]|nr:hypothetical protein [Nitrospira sp.]